MSDVTLLGYTTPFIPNSGVARFDKNAPLTELPIQRLSMVVPVPVTLIRVENDADSNLIITIPNDILLDDATEAHVTNKWDFGTISHLLSQMNVLKIPIIIHSPKASKTNKGIN